MLYSILYVLVILLELLFALGFSIYTFFLIYSNLKGSPYVPTKMKEARMILEQAKLKPNQLFLELGSGDGRLSRLAAKDYKVNSIGIDVNPLLNWYARLWARWLKIPRVTFLTQNIFQTDLRKADVLYLFLMPKLIEKLKLKMEKELKKNSLVISHGFKVLGWEAKCFKTLNHRPFPTYYYRV
ncbi:hypothetical protein A2866_06735 [Candidatus Roizmanbacteria bacterium RIFCSPHIGHO2_01_FULL_39_8]|uniref:DOT1 domain-containing protein n=3 Tax=Candidatus Roizmaniibacteriota TaxID=1752723 RepID=A0A1F7GLP9_9BACT|nr:MAG: hypothetical protein A2866_06735 [Candidatus Roizmanbacteria bacterium RIFCSPHIGHO2_01_FULL_39_8]OGK28100.1 MAG: hypothetical protein A3C28_04995 [Candidatus Roizmanbacteria bacterium RIFCSPHIGHO2_02_FULL_39_9]OGK35445.1 MAG: hypothetical protein A3F60_04175 [Candidatus Roizmanbacteria bacterium RIFCSPHIGHO2_12_FULL_39_8]